MRLYAEVVLSITTTIVDTTVTVAVQAEQLPLGLLTPLVLLCYIISPFMIGYHVISSASLGPPASGLSAGGR